jgi:hypothetical protein
MIAHPPVSGPALATRWRHGSWDGHSGRIWQAVQRSPGPSSQMRARAIPALSTSPETIIDKTVSMLRICDTAGDCLKQFEIHGVRLRRLSLLAVAAVLSISPNLLISREVYHPAALAQRLR